MKKIEKEQAIRLRREGYSMKEISDSLVISKSTASKWTSGITLDGKAKRRIAKLILDGQNKSAEKKRQRTKEKLGQFEGDARAFVEAVKLTKAQKKLICSLLYWCEGGKQDNRNMQFTNSDPNLVRTFLGLMRESYPIDERKFRICMHLHDYHDEAEQKAFWTGVTKIPETQFIKSYRKQNGGKRVRENYQGCIMIKYYDANVAREILAIGRVFTMEHRGVR